MMTTNDVAQNGVVGQNASALADRLLGRMGGEGAPGLFDRLMGRLGRRLEFGSSSLFFARMGLADPWTQEGALDEDVEGAGLRFVFLDGSSWLRRLLTRRGGAARGLLLRRLERGADNDAFAHQAWADSAWRGGELRQSAYARLVRDALLNLVEVPSTDGNVEVVSYSEDGLRMVFTRPVEAEALPEEARPLAHARNRRRTVAAPKRARKGTGLRPVTERSPLVARVIADREAELIDARAPRKATRVEAEAAPAARGARRAGEAGSRRVSASGRVGGRSALAASGSSLAIDARRAGQIVRSVERSAFERRAEVTLAAPRGVGRAAARALGGRGLAASPTGSLRAEAVEAGVLALRTLGAGKVGLGLGAEKAGPGASAAVDLASERAARRSGSRLRRDGAGRLSVMSAVLPASYEERKRTERERVERQSLIVDASAGATGVARGAAAGRARIAEDRRVVEGEGSPMAQARAGVTRAMLRDQVRAAVALGAQRAPVSSSPVAYVGAQRLVSAWVDGAAQAERSQVRASVASVERGFAVVQHEIVKVERLVSAPGIAAAAASALTELAQVMVSAAGLLDAEAPREVAAALQRVERALQATVREVVAQVGAQATRALSAEVLPSVEIGVPAAAVARVRRAVAEVESVARRATVSVRAQVERAQREASRPEVSAPVERVVEKQRVVQALVVAGEAVVRVGDRTRPEVVAVRAALKGAEAAVRRVERALGGLARSDVGAGESAPVWQQLERELIAIESKLAEAVSAAPGGAEALREVARGGALREASPAVQQRAGRVRAAVARPAVDRARVESVRVLASIASARRVGVPEVAAAKAAIAAMEVAAEPAAVQRAQRELQAVEARLQGVVAAIEGGVEAVRAAGVAWRGAAPVAGVAVSEAQVSAAPRVRARGSRRPASAALRAAGLQGAEVVRTEALLGQVSPVEGERLAALLQGAGSPSRARALAQRWLRKADALGLALEGEAGASARALGGAAVVDGAPARGEVARLEERARRFAGEPAALARTDVLSPALGASESLARVFGISRSPVVSERAIVGSTLAASLREELGLGASETRRMGELLERLSPEARAVVAQKGAVALAEAVRRSSLPAPSLDWLERAEPQAAAEVEEGRPSGRAFARASAVEAPRVQRSASRVVQRGLAQGLQRRPATESAPSFTPGFQAVFGAQAPRAGEALVTVPALRAALRGVEMPRVDVRGGRLVSVDATGHVRALPISVRELSALLQSPYSEASVAESQGVSGPGSKALRATQVELAEARTRGLGEVARRRSGLGTPALVTPEGAPVEEGAVAAPVEGRRPRAAASAVRQSATARLHAQVDALVEAGLDPRIAHALRRSPTPGQAVEALERIGAGGGGRSALQRVLRAMPGVDVSALIEGAGLGDPALSAVSGAALSKSGGGVRYRGTTAPSIARRGRRPGASPSAATGPASAGAAPTSAAGGSRLRWSAAAGSPKLVEVFARSESPEEMLRVLLERRPEELPQELRPVAMRIARLVDEAKVVGEGFQRSQEVSAAEEPTLTVIKPPTRREHQPSRGKRTLSRGAAGAKHVDGVPLSKIQELASKLEYLVDLAERDRQAARAQVRMAEDSAAARAEGSGGRPDGGRASEPMAMQALRKEVFESLMREFELRESRNPGDPEGFGYW